MANALVAMSLPAGAVKALLWGIKLIVLGKLLYVAFWLTVVGIGIAVVVWNARHPVSGEVDKGSYEWRYDYQNLFMIFKIMHPIWLLPGKTWKEGKAARAT